jgi:hypothetical protein
MYAIRITSPNTNPTYIILYSVFDDLTIQHQLENIHKFSGHNYDVIAKSQRISQKNRPATIEYHIFTNDLTLFKRILVKISPRTIIFKATNRKRTRTIEVTQNFFQIRCKRLDYRIIGALDEFTVVECVVI